MISPLELIPDVSIVIPAYNECHNIVAIIDEVSRILVEQALAFEIIVINDGSADDTLACLIQNLTKFPFLKVIDLSRNFGKEAALTAGLSEAAGRCAIVMDADFQDPPDLIPQMLSTWKEGFDTVVAVRDDRETDSLFRRWATAGFYRFINAVSHTSLIPNAGDYRLLDRCVVNAFLALPERSRFNKGLFAWLGFKQAILYHPRPLRAAGTSTFTVSRLFGLAIDGITSFSSFPLRLWTYVGSATALLALIYGTFILLRTLIHGVDVPGYASIIIAVMFLGGINLLSIGILGEYIGRIFLEAKQRPIYIIRKIYTHTDSERSPKAP